jgi:hypothetical protein
VLCAVLHGLFGVTCGVMLFFHLSSSPPFPLSLEFVITLLILFSALSQSFSSCNLLSLVALRLVRGVGIPVIVSSPPTKRPHSSYRHITSTSYQSSSYHMSYTSYISNRAAVVCWTIRGLRIDIGNASAFRSEKSPRPK